MNQQKKIANRIFSIVFVCLIFGLALVNILGPKHTFSENENRSLQQKPEFCVDDFFSGDYTSDYESYVSDQFWNRDFWIKLKVKVERKFGKQEVNQVYFAKDNYLIEKHTPLDVNTELIEKNTHRIQNFVQIYGDHIDGNISVMIVPTASEILKDKMPKYAPNIDEESLIQQVSEDVIGENVKVIDLVPSLQKHSDEYIYYRTDHHWTTLGAWYSYQTWQKELGGTLIDESDVTKETVSTDFYGTTYSKVNIPLESDSIDIYHSKWENQCKIIVDEKEEQSSLYDFEFLKTKDQYAMFLSGNHAIVNIETGQKTGKILLVIKDSYANCFVPFLVGQYDNIIMLDYRYFTKSTKEIMESNEITDVLILYNAVNFAQDQYLGKLLK